MELWRYDGAVTKLNTTAKRGFVGVRKAANADDDQVLLKVLHVDAVNTQPERLDATVLYALPLTTAAEDRPHHALNGVSALTSAVVDPSSTRRMPDCQWRCWSTSCHQPFRRW